MTAGRKAVLKSAVCKNGICVPTFSMLDGPEVGAQSHLWSKTEQKICCLRNKHRFGTAEVLSLQLAHRL